MYSKYMTPVFAEVVQFILLSFKVQKSFTLALRSCIVYGLAGEGEYAGYNRLTIYSTLYKKVIFDDSFVTDDNLKKTLEHYLDFSVQRDL